MGRISPRSIAATAALILATLLVPGGAGANASWQKSTIASVALGDVAFGDIQRGWAVGNGGTILTTTNGGATWAAQSSTVSFDLRAADAVSSTTAWAGGMGDEILRTTDGGATWQRSSTGTGGNVYDIDFVDATHGWAAGYTSLLVQFVVATTDGGATWTRQAAPYGIGLTGVSFADRQHGFLTGFFGAQYRTEDGGATWTPMSIYPQVWTEATNETVYTVLRISAEEGLAAGFLGNVYRTEDGGTTWAKVATLGKTVRRLAVSGSSAFAAGDGGLVARSDDGGVTWQAEASGTSVALQGVTAPTPAAAYAVGNAGTLVAWRDEVVPPLPLTVGLYGESCAGVERVWTQETAGPSVAALPLDVDADGEPEIVIAGTEGMRAVEPFVDTLDATLWSVPFQTRFQRLIAAELDGTPGPEILGATAAAGEARSGLIAVDANGDVLWSRRLPGGARRIRAGDLDGDGIDDVVALGDDRAVRTLRGTTGEDLHPARPLGGNVTDARLADLSGDGTPDVVITTDAGLAIAIDGASGGTLWSFQVPGGDLTSAATPDLTGDGTPDVVVGGAGQARSLTPGQGDGTTAVGSRRGGLVTALDGRDGAWLWDYMQAGFYDVEAVATADLTGDGTPDVVGHSSRLGSSHLLALDGRGREVAGARTGEPLALWASSTDTTGDTGIQKAYNPDALSLGDGTGDGVADAYVGLWSGGPFAVSGTVPPAQAGLRPPDAEALWAVPGRGIGWSVRFTRIAGRPYVLSAVGDGLVSLRDAATGEVAWAYDAGVLPVTMTVDLDGDGDDEVVAGSAGGRVRATGDGPDALGPDLFLPAKVTALAAADADGDGIAEAIAGLADGTVHAVDPIAGEVHWSADLGSEVRAAATVGGDPVVGLADGTVIALDAATGAEGWREPWGAAVNVVAAAGGLAAAGYEDGTIRTLDGGGEAAAMSTGTGLLGGVYALEAADLDADGILELAAGAGYNYLSYELSGAERWLVATGYFAVDLATGDLNGDGAVDVLAPSRDDTTAAVDGRTGTRMWATTAGDVFDAAIADVTGDGAPEVVLAVSDFARPEGLRVLSATGADIGSCTPRKGALRLEAPDLDGDGVADPVVAMEQGDLYRFRV